MFVELMFDLHADTCFLLMNVSILTNFTVVQVQSTYRNHRYRPGEQLQLSLRTLARHARQIASGFKQTEVGQTGRQADRQSKAHGDSQPCQLKKQKGSSREDRSVKQSTWNYSISYYTRP